MAELLRFNIKKKTGVYFDKNQKLLNKFYIENNSARHKNELRGYLWYLEKLKKKNFIKFSSKSNYFQIPLINGKKFNFWEKFLDEKKKISEIVKHYKKFWPSKKKVPFHGDLTLENIIFTGNKNKVFFIDWENFNTNKDWGLDICYFLISLLVLPYQSLNKKVISQSDLKKFSFLWKKYFNKNEYSYKTNPIDALKIIIKEKNNFIYKINSKMLKQIKFIINNDSEYNKK